MNTYGFILPARIIGVIILVSALLPLALGGWFFFSTRSFLQSATSASGTVVAMQESRNSEKGTMYTPVFEFQDGAGQTHKIVSSWSSSPPSHAVGGSVDVLYEPANPAGARFDGFRSLWLGPIICGAIGIMSVLFALLFLWLVPFTIRRVWPREPGSPAT